MYSFQQVPASAVHSRAPASPSSYSLYSDGYSAAQNLESNHQLTSHSVLSNRTTESSDTVSFFQSETFRNLTEARTMEELGMQMVSDPSASTNQPELLDMPSVDQLSLLPIDTVDMQNIVPGEHSNERNAFCEWWAHASHTNHAALVMAGRQPGVSDLTANSLSVQANGKVNQANTPIETAQSNNPSLALKFLYTTTRSMRNQPMQWVVYGATTVLRTEMFKQALASQLTTRLAQLIHSLYSNHLSRAAVRVACRNNPDMGESEVVDILAKELSGYFQYLPTLAQSAASRTRRLSGKGTRRGKYLAHSTSLVGEQADHLLTKAVIEVTHPLVLNMLLLTPPAQLAKAAALSALASGLVVLNRNNSSPPNAQQTRMERAEQQVGAGATHAAIALASSLASKLVLGDQVGTGNSSFTLGQIQYQIASSLTSNVLQHMGIRETTGVIHEPQYGPPLLHILLEQSKRDFTFLSYRQYLSTRLRKAKEQVVRTGDSIWRKQVAPLLPEPLHKLTLLSYATFAISFGSWLAYASLPYHIDYLRSRTKWAADMHLSLHRLVESATWCPESKWLQFAYGMSKDTVSSSFYTELWDPFLDMVLRDHFGIADAVRRRVASTH